jgi:hypothetical protein
LATTGSKRISRQLPLEKVKNLHNNRIVQKCRLRLFIFARQNNFSMKRTAYNILLAIVTIGLFSLPAAAQLPHLIFHAELNGAEQIPAVNTPAKGLITLLYSPDRTKVGVSGLLVDLQGDVTEVSLHIGKTGEEGAFIISLMPAVQGKRLHGDVEVPVTLLQNLLPDRAYVSVSTTAHNGGEIRGQFICETDLDYGTALNGIEAVPANPSNGYGFGGVHFPTGSEDLVYAYLTQNLSSPATEMGIYQGEVGQNGVLVHSFEQLIPGLWTGIIDLALLPAGFLRDAREGKYYIAVKTENYPEGEIRGQINFLGYFTSFSPVNAPQVVPNAGGSPGFGFSHNVINQTIDSITTTVFITGITPLSVDIHVGLPTQNGPIIETLSLTSTPGLYRKTYAVDPARLTDFVDGKLYILVPTANKPNGEIRGVMKNSLRKGYAFDLCAQQVVPPTNSTAFGVGMASVDQANCYLNYKVIYDDLSGPANEAFVCQAFPSMNGNALYPMPTTKPIIPGYQEIEAGHGVAIELGETYVLLVTEAFPNGEIRGQIVRGFSCPAESSVSAVNNVHSIAVSPVPFQSELTVTFDSEVAFEGQLVLYDVLGTPAMRQAIQVVTGSQTLRLPTDHLPGGYYSLLLETPGQRSSVLLKKLIRQQ